MNAVAELGQLVVTASYVLIFAATALVSHMLFKQEETRAAQENLEDLQDRQAPNALVKWLRPFFTQYIVPMVRGKKTWEPRRVRYRRRLISAGLKNELTPDEFVSFKLILILVFPVIGTLLKALEIYDAQWYHIVASSVAGWFYPDWWIKGIITKRQKQIKKAMPFIVDLLALSTEAGLDFVGAMAKVVDKANSSPLVDEFSQVLKEIKVGSSRQEALREMAARVDMPEVGSFVAILISAEQMGASIGKILRQQSEMIRIERFVSAERAGAIAGQKLILPIVLIILPAVMLMIGAPFVLSMMGSGAGS